MNFYVGLGQQSHIMWVKDRFMLSFQVCRKRKHVWGIPDNLEWIMDSGAFNELKKHGEYTYTPEEYMTKVEIWQPDYFVSMDWMCEPFQLKKTGKTTKEHQQLSLDNQIRLTELLEDSWINKHTELIGVIQGWSKQDYIEHIDMLKEHDMMLPYMGIGSVCRRRADKKIIGIIRTIRKEAPNIKLHGFGVKTSLLKHPITYDCLDSVDSMAWCFAGWVSKRGGGNLFKTPCWVHPYKKCHKQTDDCANCGRFMNNWVNKNLRLIKNNGLQTKLIDNFEFIHNRERKME